MFWNSEFLNASSSHIDVLLQMQTTKLSDILFEDDLLQELKTSNVNLTDFLMKPEIISELVDNITQLTEKDCCDKLLYSRVHAAYISCEILTAGSSEIFAALLNHPDSLNKIISCLTTTPKQSSNNYDEQKVDNNTLDNENGRKSDDDGSNSTNTNTSTSTGTSTNTSTNNDTKNDDDNENNNTNSNTENDGGVDDDDDDDDDDVDDNDGGGDGGGGDNETESKAVTKVVPQKATLVSKLISTIHSGAPENLSCHITQDIESFSKLIRVLVHNIDVSGSFEILSTFINRTCQPELRYVFCEILSKLNFVFSLINVMTLSNVEDKQRNACQLLCDIIVIGRQEASEQTNSGPMAQDMLAEFLESKQAVHMILFQMFSEENRTNTNTTAIVCGMKVLQTLVEQKAANDVQNNLVVKTIEQIQEEIESCLIYFHQLLLNPPKQEPIKTTFGVIQKPLGYIRLEVVNLIRALISTNSPKIIRKLVELRTMKVIIDLFIDYSWNNLLHTQVEQALCLIIKNCRHDEEMNYQIDMEKHTNHINSHHQNGIESSSPSEIVKNTANINNNVDDKLGKSQQSNNSQENESSNQNQREQGQMQKSLQENGDLQEQDRENLQSQPKDGETNSQHNHNHDNEKSNKQKQEYVEDKQGQQQHHHQQQEELESRQKQSSHQVLNEKSIEDIPSRALLSQALNECDLIGRLLLPSGGGKQANFGHIIQIINSIAINCDLDTIRDHLNEMKDKRPELYDRWTTFVSVDVASFKEISLYYDVQSANNRVNDRYANLSRNRTELFSDSIDHNSTSSDNNVNNFNGNFDDQLRAYLSFTKETVIPSINVDVLPNRRSHTTRFRLSDRELRQ